MSDESKCFARPKVRFSRSADSPTSSEAVGAFAKPRIRSIVKLRPSVKILKAPSLPNEDERSSSPEDTNLRYSVGDAPNDLRLCPPKTSSRSAPCLTEIVLTPENRCVKPKSLSDRAETSKSFVKSPKNNYAEKNNDVQEKTPLSEKTLKQKPKDAGAGNGVSRTPFSENCLGKENIAEARDLKKNIAESRELKKNISETGESKKNASEARESKKNVSETRESKKNISEARESKRNVSEARESQRNVSEARESKRNVSEARESKRNVSETRESKRNLSASRGSKENVPRAPRNTPRTQSDEGTKLSSSKSPSAAPILKRAETSTKKSRKDVPKGVKPKTAPIGLMPCMKSSRDRSKSAPVKKTIMRDATAIPSQVYVGPGIVRPRSLGEETRAAPRPPRARSEILSGDKLARPEYNSIVNTMKKLREAREERIAEDLEHLPAVYRRLVNGKVSSALDFGANEAIYRDLVDLSIDEKQLPSRLTRSKDPEPRQRDLVPKLSDFFVPRNDEEYRRAVLVRPPSPRVLDTWNPYKVSDRIFSWKESLDHDH